MQAAASPPQSAVSDAAAETPATPPCMYCGGTRFSPLFAGVRDRLGHVGGEWAFLKCAGCGAAALSPHPRREQLVSFYPAVYNFTPDAEGRTLVQRVLAFLEYRLFFRVTYEAQARRVLRAIAWPRGKPGRLLDIGCGRGLRLLAFRNRGLQVEGMDFQLEAVQYVRQRLGIHAVCSDDARLAEDLPHAAYDVITAFCVLEHLPDVEAVLRACRLLLKPGGWFAATVPLVDSLQARWLGKRWVNVTEAPRHLSLPSTAALRQVCLRAGYESIQLKSDSTLSCAALVGLSLFPGCATTHLYGGGKMKALFLRGLAAVASFLAIPWTLIENYVLRRPGHGLLLARKPVALAD